MNKLRSVLMAGLLCAVAGSEMNAAITIPNEVIVAVAGGLASRYASWASQRYGDFNKKPAFGVGFAIGTGIALLNIHPGQILIGEALTYLGTLPFIPVKDDAEVQAEKRARLQAKHIATGAVLQTYRR